MQAWVGNAGMLFEETENGCTLRCNSSPEITFDDLVIQLVFD